MVNCCQSLNAMGVGHLFSGMVWVDFDLLYSTACLTLCGQMGIWQNWPDSKATWRIIKIQVNLTQVSDQMKHFVLS